LRQASVYRDLETLYKDTIAQSPGSWAAMANLSNHLSAVGRQAEAMELARRAVSIAPHESEVQGNLAALLMADASSRGFPPAELAEAVDHFEQAVAMNAENSNARKGLAFALIIGKKFQAAQDQLAAVLQKLPGDATALYGRGVAHEGRGDWAAACDDYAAALQANPDYIDAHHHLAIALEKLGETEQAIVHLQRSVELDPRRVASQFELANLLSRQKNFTAAARHFAAVVALRPNEPAALNNLGAALLAAGRADQAVNYFRQALRLAPDYADAKVNLEHALRATRQAPGK
jgi:tetratricopeptide (TPR) repeat protein